MSRVREVTICTCNVTTRLRKRDWLDSRFQPHNRLSICKLFDYRWLFSAWNVSAPDWLSWYWIVVSLPFASVHANRVQPAWGITASSPGEREDKVCGGRAQLDFELCAELASCKETARKQSDGDFAKERYRARVKIQNTQAASNSQRAMRVNTSPMASRAITVS